jgi:heme A synthase
MFMGVHLLNTFVLIAFLALTAWWLAGGERLSLRAHPGLAAVLGAATAGLLLTGSSGAIAALGDTLFPHGSLSEALTADLSPTSHLLIRLRVLHPAFAVVTAGALLFGGAVIARGRGRAASSLARAVATLCAAQLALGALNVALLAPIWLQIVHLLVADLLWIAFVLLAAAVLAPAAASGRIRNTSAA